MEKPLHEPGEPSAEELAEQYGEILGRLHGIREMFLAKQGMANELSIAQAEDAFQRFESEQIESILSKIEKTMTIPWKGHPDSVADEASDTEASADTYIDPVAKKLVRYEVTEAEGTEQIEIIMSYCLNSLGRIERSISTDTEIIDNSLESFEHPALVPLDLPGGERANILSSPEPTTQIELDTKQAMYFVNMMREIVSNLAQVYNNSGWLILPDTDRANAYKIERPELD